MQLTVLGSSSAGNCYLFESKSQVLILEAGLPLKAVKEALKFDISKVVGCVISHEHGDHAIRVKEFIAAGIPVYASRGTIDAIIVRTANSDFGMKAMQSNRRIQIGEFGIMPFDIKHDANEPFGFLIKHQEMGLCLFVTDTHYVQFKFPGLNQILIEANYEAKILEDNVWNGTIDNMRYQRVLRSHMSLETCIEALKANDLTGVQNIVLIHLSPQNSDAELFRNKVIEATGKPTYIAKKGLEIDFSLNPY